MELKKSKKVDLENKRNLFFQIGLVIALGAVFMAFIGKNQVSPLNTFESATDQIDDDVVYTPPVLLEMPKVVPPPPSALLAFQLTPDDQTIDNIFEFILEEPGDPVVFDVPMLKYSSNIEDESDSIFTIAEDMPEFPGGPNALLLWISKNTIYPQVALQNEVQGKVFVSFVVDKTGKVVDAKVTRSVDPSLDAEALRIVNSLPRWKPGMQRMKPVNVSYSVPINFKLF